MPLHLVYLPGADWLEFVMWGLLHLLNLSRYKLLVSQIYFNVKLNQVETVKKFCNIGTRSGCLVPDKLQ